MPFYEPIFGILKHVTDRAILLDVRGEGEHEVWIPKSAIDNEPDITEIGDEIDVDVAQWFLEKEALI
jgi:hypothetical protein